MTEYIYGAFDEIIALGYTPEEAEAILEEMAEA